MPFVPQNFSFHNFITNGLPTQATDALSSVSIITFGATSIATPTGNPPTPLEVGSHSSQRQAIQTASSADTAVKVPSIAPLAQTAAQSLNSLDLTSLTQQEPYTYTGSDLRVFLDIPGASGQQLLELTTITVSVHREKAPVRAIGYINPKAFARGRRTIAGTMVLTQFYADVMYRFLGMQWSRDLSKDAKYKKPDQLPPFNLTFLFADEYGHASYRRLLGVDAVTDGTVYSTNDMMTEQTISFMAADFTPLLPLDISAVLNGSSDQGSVCTPADARKEELTPVVTSRIVF